MHWVWLSQKKRNLWVCAIYLHLWPSRISAWRRRQKIVCRNVLDHSQASIKTEKDRKYRSIYFIVTYNNFTEARSKNILTCPLQKMSRKELLPPRGCLVRGVCSLGAVCLVQGGCLVRGEGCGDPPVTVTAAGGMETWLFRVTTISITF